MADANNTEKIFDKFSNKISKLTGSSKAFFTALAIVLAWIITGPIFHFSDTWQLVINTGTTIITFLMVFVIQEAQNKDTMAVHLKLNELIAATKGASNHVINIEDMDEDELKALKKLYTILSSKAQKNESGESISIDKMPHNIPRDNENQ